MLPVLTRTAAARAARRPVLPRIRPGTTPPAALRKESTQANPPAKDLFTRFAKLDPELYGILAVTLGAVGVFGYFVGTHVPSPPLLSSRAMYTQARTTGLQFQCSYPLSYRRIKAKGKHFSFFFHVHLNFLPRALHR